MIRGLYTGAAGMLSETIRMDVVANNLANADKTAFKSDITVFKSFPQMLIRRLNDDGVRKFPLGSYDTMPIVGRLGTGVEVNEVYTNFEQGSLRETNNPFDFAIEGDGFFVVETERGLRYTRNGSFLLDKDNYIVTKDGYKVLGENGYIKVQSNNFVVNEKGEIIVNRDLYNRQIVSNVENDWASSEIIDRFKIVTFREKRELKKEGNSFYYETEFSGPAYTPEPENMPKIRQGFIEQSNVNIVKEMVYMIEVQRAYEANSKSVISHDNALGRLFNTFSRV
jgi:flagellar basal-body rod protein FlgG